MSITVGAIDPHLKKKGLMWELQNNGYIQEVIVRIDELLIEFDGI